MDRLKSLYFSLSPSEKKSVRNYLEAFHQKGENKSLEFLKLLDHHPDINHESASQKLYDDPRSKAFIMMKSRLSDRLTEFLTMSVNPELPETRPRCPLLPGPDRIPEIDALCDGLCRRGIFQSLPWKPW
jgi:hypothetical protein